MVKSKSDKQPNDPDATDGGEDSAGAKSSDAAANDASSNDSAADTECSNRSLQSDPQLSLAEIQAKLVARRAQHQQQTGTTIDPMADQSSLWARFRKPIISTFLAFNVIAIGLHVCAPSPFRDKLVAPFNRYLWYTGLWQDFCVFVPEPKDYNIRLSAKVFKKDGSEIHYAFPNPADDNHLKKMSTERYRKWAHDNVNQPTYRLWWPDTCIWIAHKYNDTPDNPVARVELYRHWSEIRPPGSTKAQGPENIAKFYTYSLRPGDLQ